MPRTQCSYCGLPFNVRRIEAGRADYCCSGCALASRLPQPGAGGQFPATPALFIALGAGFAFFNEVLFWALGLELTREHRGAEALLLLRISGGLGILIGAGMVAMVWLAGGPRRWTDGLVTVVALGALAWAAVRMRSAGDVFLVNAALAIWLARGWGKRKFARNRSLTI
jgi:hypothetical protein